MGYFDLIGFGTTGWGKGLLTATMMTVLVALSGFALGAVIGILVAAAKLTRILPLRILGDAYTTVLRGVPDLLVIYLLYFGGSAALGFFAGLFGAEGFIGMPAFLTGTVALGIISGAYQAEVFRGAYLAIDRGQREAALSLGLRRFTLFFHVIAPQALRYALPGLGNVWQLILKESALISVTGLVELLRQSQIAAGSTRQPFTFYLTAAVLYLAITSVSALLFRRAEQRTMRGTRRVK